MHKHRSERKQDRFLVDHVAAAELRRKLPADGHALLDRMLEAMQRDPNSNLTGHLVGQGSANAHGGAWPQVSLGEFAETLTRSEGLLHDCRHVAGMWSAQEVARLQLFWNVLVVIARGAPKLADRIGTTVREARELLAKVATEKSLTVDAVKALITSSELIRRAVRSDALSDASDDRGGP